MTRRRGATVLPAALVLLAVSAAVAAMLADLARVELLVAQQRTATAEALDAVDACLADAIAPLPAGWDFAALLAGADGVPGTADDGALAAAAGCTATAVAAPGPVAPPRMLARIAAATPRGARAAEAIVGLDGTPGVRAPLWLARTAALGPIDGTLELVVDPPATDAGALAAPDDPPALDAWVAAQGGRARLAVGTPPPRHAPPPPLATLYARARNAGALAAPALAPAPAPPAALAAVAGDVTVAAPRWGRGLLVVDGTVLVEADLTFSGVLAATGGVVVAPGARLVVDGALWVDGPLAGHPAPMIQGDARLRWDAAAIDVAEALLPLPRRARLAGLRDDG